MITICSSADMARALESSLPADLARLLEERRDQLAEYDDYDLGELANYVVVEPGDTAAAIIAELGFDPATNLTNDKRMGEPGFTPSWEDVPRQPGWIELPFILSDDGFGKVLLIPARDDIDPDLLALVQAHA
jgi:hypothetical protein